METTTEIFIQEPPTKSKLEELVKDVSDIREKWNNGGITQARLAKAHANATCYCFAGVPIISYQGAFYTYKEFFEAFPIHAITIKTDINYKGDNTNTTNEWYH